MSSRYCITGSEPVWPATGDGKTSSAAIGSPLSPLSLLEMKSRLKRCTGHIRFTSNTSDTGEVVLKIIGLGVGEAANFRGSTP
jgi:hypothetical protein